MEKQSLHVRPNNQFQSQRVLRPVPQPFLTILAHKKIATDGQVTSVRNKMERYKKTRNITLNESDLKVHSGFRGAKVLKKRSRKTRTANASSSHSLQKDLVGITNLFSTPTLTTNLRFIYSLGLYQKRTPCPQENKDSSNHNKGLQSCLVRRSTGKLRAFRNELGMQPIFPQPESGVSSLRL